MPMPKLLKKLSRKSLRGHNSEAETDSESLPLLPPSEYDSHLEDSPRSFTPPLKRFGSAGNSSATSSPRPSGDWSHQVMRSTSTGTVSTDKPLRTLTQIRAFHTHHQAVVHQRGPGQPLMAAVWPLLQWRAILERGPATPSPGVQGVQQPWPQVPNDDPSRDLAGAWEIANTALKVSKVNQVLLVAGSMEVIEHGLNTSTEGIPVLMNAFDEVAKLHPFIGVAVMALI
ncbi:hypothetical protein DFH08DRAFT_966453 [Mycena albidolilacea]|uniref:Uncharacterized protein n=1 Tax=Mycena albidolilacea TaxID=1033008 RepID=A0AAD6ZNR7_9AGAR|nr:hypothetical protein DFH08DRAFT_966453 [Mycena albidolilacea]